MSVAGTFTGSGLMRLRIMSDHKFELKRHCRACQDHTGRKFNSVMEMREFWGVSCSAWNYRTRNKWPLEKILTTHKHCVTDHTGREFKSETDMAKAWGIKADNYRVRRSRGMSIEEALTTPVKYAQKFADPENGLPVTRSEWADARGMSHSTLCMRTKRFKDREDLIYFDGCLNKIPCRDHEGHEFESLTKMAEHWGIPLKTLSKRLDRYKGDVQKALTTPYKPHYGKRVRDHTGEVFESVAAMCRKWGIQPRRFRVRMQSGWEVEYALTVPVSRGRYRCEKYLDPHRNERKYWYDDIVV